MICDVPVSMQREHLTGERLVTGEDPAHILKQRAEQLRDAAKRARGMADGLGTYLDAEVKLATGTGKDAIWLGPYAVATTARLAQHAGTLHRMASGLLADAKRWDAAATDLEHRAAHAKDKRGGR